MAVFALCPASPRPTSAAEWRRSLSLAGNYHCDDIQHPVTSPSSHGPSFPITPVDVFSSFCSILPSFEVGPRAAFLEDCESHPVPFLSSEGPRCRIAASCSRMHLLCMSAHLSFQSARVSTVPAGWHGATAREQLDSVAALAVGPTSGRGCSFPPFLLLFSEQMQDGCVCTRLREILSLSSQRYCPLVYRPRGCDAFRVCPSPGLRKRP